MSKAFLLFALLSIPVAARAQFGRDQAQALRGIYSVQVINNGGLDQTSMDWLTLEMRKVGLRVARDSSDAIFNVSVRATRGVLSTAVDFRIDVEQMVNIARTGERLQLVTWYFENRQEPTNGQWNTAYWNQMLTSGANRFFQDWLTANGR